MAIQINLLPWREERRTKNKNISIGFLIAGAVLAIILAGASYLLIETSINNQEDNFNALNKQNNIVLAKLSLLKKAEDKRKLLMEQISSIEALQARRGDVTHLLEELADTVADKDVFLTSFELKSKHIDLTGIAKNEKVVADLMSGLKSTGWFDTPELISMESSTGSGSEVKVFKIVSGLVIKSDEPKKDGISDKKSALKDKKGGQ